MTTNELKSKSRTTPPKKLKKRKAPFPGKLVVLESQRSQNHHPLRYNLISLLTKLPRIFKRVTLTRAVCPQCAPLDEPFWKKDFNRPQVM